MADQRLPDAGRERSGMDQIFTALIALAQMQQNAVTPELLATAINPAVGLGSFLAQWLLRQPLQSATTQEFRITGGWADPQVEKVTRPATTPGDI